MLFANEKSGERKQYESQYRLQMEHFLIQQASVWMDVRVTRSSTLRSEMNPTLKVEQRLELRLFAAVALESSAAPFLATNRRNRNRIRF